MVRIGDVGEPGVQAPQQIAQRRAGETQQAQRFRAGLALDQSEFAVVADAFELKHQIAVVEDGRGVRINVHSADFAPTRMAPV